MNYKLVMCTVLSLLLISVVTPQESKAWKAVPLPQMSQSYLQCPPWFFYNATSQQCECYNNPSTDNIVKCSEKGALLRFGYCMTYEDGEGFYVGLCDYFNLGKYNRSTKGDYISLPNNISELNDYMCGPLNRKGMMCGQCIEGFGLSITSMGHACSNCTGAWFGVPLYLFLEFVPITIFYFIILFFRINMTSAPMVAFVFYCQTGVSTFFIVSNRYLFSGTLTYYFLSILITFYGIWNLDFFRYVIPPFCVSPHIKGIHITFLHFVSAFYPLCLVAMSWICIELHSRNYKLMHWLWNKLKSWVSKYTNDKLDVKNTMIDVFATCFLLCYAKLVFTCLGILSYRVTVNVHNLSTHNIFHVKTDSTVVFFSREHLPFAIISVAIFLVVLLPTPLILALFPINAFRSLLFKCQSANRLKAALSIFVDKFYSCYRDGLDGARDMRSFVSIHFFLRIIGNFCGFDDVLSNISFTIIVVLYGTSSLLIAIVRPYKKAYMNITDTLIFANLALIALVLTKYSGQENYNSPSSAFYEISGSILSTLPLLGLTVVVIYKIFKVFKRFCNTKSVYRTQEECTHMEVPQQVNLESSDDPELPYRMLHPDHVQYPRHPSYGSTEQSYLKQYP